jgi:hypothetical protein
MNLRSCLFTLTATLTLLFGTPAFAKECEHIKHNIQLQLADGNGFLVQNTQFWVTLDIVKQGDLVTVLLPLINFQAGEMSSDSPFIINQSTGGFLQTVDGFIPKEFRPLDLVPRSVIAASNNGLSPVFSFVQDPATLPQPPPGYIVEITRSGELRIMGAGSFENMAPAGPNIVMPVSITYLAEKQKKLSKNYNVSRGFTDVTQFAPVDVNDSLRDTHVFDAYKDTVVWVWNDNSSDPNKTDNTLNVRVAVGHVDKHGKLKVGKPIQLTNFPPNVTSEFCNAVTINRKDPKNIVVSYCVTDRSNLVVPHKTSTYCRAVSFDGGKTWGEQFDGYHPTPTNGPLTLGFPYQKPAGSDIGDARGVACDIYGNIWYLATERYDGSGILPSPGNDINQPFFAVSFDKGLNFQVVYQVPDLVDPANTTYDFPQYCFGKDQFGQYGLYFTVDFISNLTFDYHQDVGFIPINGFGLANIDTANASFVELTAFQESNFVPNITASNDGRVWLEGTPVGMSINPRVFMFKSPSATLDVNWTGSLDEMVYHNQDFDTFFIPSGEISQEVRGYFNSAQTIIFDDQRQALYSCIAAQNPDYSQDINIFLHISRNNGLTWSKPILVNTSSFANRGFQSMALDPATGNLFFGFYDGRNDPTFKAVQYFGAMLPAKKLDKLVNDIPLSNPLFITSSASVPPDIGN